MWVRSCSNLWCGLITFFASLAGTLLLRNEPAHPWAVLLLICAAVLAVIVWGQQEWIPAFPGDPVAGVLSAYRSHFFYLVGAVSAFLLALAANFHYLVVPNETFGLAGVLWLASIGLLLCAAFVGSQSAPDGS